MVSFLKSLKWWAQENWFRRIFNPSPLRRRSVYREGGNDIEDGAVRVLPVGLHLPGREPAKCNRVATEWVETIAGANQRGGIEKMKMALLIILMAIVFTGCATQTAMPVRPAFFSEDRKECASICELTYQQCNLSCGQMIGGETLAEHRRECFSGCNQTLEKCYSDCQAPKF